MCISSEDLSSGETGPPFHGPAMKQGIITAIAWSVSAGWHADIRHWHIGITHDVARVYAASGRPRHFRSWQADSLQDAREIEAYFIRKGMQGGAEGELDPEREGYVYIF